MEGVKAQHIFITNAVCNGIAVQFIAENRGSGWIFLSVFFFNRRASKAKENRIGESVLNGEQHIAKSSAVGFINDKHQTFATDLLDVSLIHPFFRLDITHFLNGGNNQAVAVLFAFQLAEQNGSIFRFLHITFTVGKIFIFK